MKNKIYRTILSVFSMIAVTLLIGTSSAFAADSHADSRWTAKYWNNKDLSGAPVAARQESKIDYNWGNGRPASGVNIDDFSARWTRTVTFEDGLYRFTMNSDDGSRLWVDGRLLIDRWYNHGAETYTADLYLSGGDHTIRMEYYDDEYVAIARLNWARITGASAVWNAEYYNNTDLSGTPALIRPEGNINYNWGRGAPASAVNADNFSARWTRMVSFSAGTYRFSLTSDDGVRLWIDGNIVIDRWYGHEVATYTADLYMTEGNHFIRVEYFEDKYDAVARLSWQQVSAPSVSDWRGEYYPNRDLRGAPALVRDDAAISFNWGLGSPANNIPSDYFSVRWTRQVTFSPGTYRFTMTTDDGARLWINGQIIIDRWYVHPTETYVADVTLSAGTHTIRMEYFEATSGAGASLDWSRWAGTGTPPPASGSQMLEATTSLNVRSGPGIGNTRIALIQPGKAYPVLGQQDGWYAIDYNGLTGWVYGYFTRITTPTGAHVSGTRLVEATTALNVRGGPGVGYERIGWLTPGKTYEVVGQRNGWYAIMHNGQIGWVSGGYVRVTIVSG